MEILNIFAIAFVQGLTEFLPVSSSGHLVLLAQFSKWDDQGVGFDVAAHLGSLLAVLLLFGRVFGDVGVSGVKSTPPRLLADFSTFLEALNSRGFSRKNSEILVYILAVAIATLPVAVLGFSFRNFIAADFRSVEMVAYSTILFGLLLGFADRFRGKKTLANLCVIHLICLGLAQSLALVPGVSRSGVTITAALMMGFSRKAAVAMSAILAVPVICLSAGLELGYFFRLADGRILVDLVLVTVMSCLSAYFSLLFLVKLVEKVGMIPFVIYRIILGSILLLFFVD